MLVCYNTNHYGTIIIMYMYVVWFYYGRDRCSLGPVFVVEWSVWLGFKALCHGRAAGEFDAAVPTSYV